jgi:hypothetical protein
MFSFFINLAFARAMAFTEPGHAIIPPLTPSFGNINPPINATMAAKATRKNQQLFRTLPPAI